MMPKNEPTSIGDRFGRLQVIAAAQIHRRGAHWECRCDCGSIRAISQRNLKSGNTQSCGCLAHELTAARNHKHGGAHSNEYAIWCTMKSRVLNPNSEKFKRYGGRGVKICERWLKFENFFADMGPRPSKDYSIERVDNDGDYCPENCKWILTVKQARNRRDTRWLTIDDVTRPFVEWCEVYGIAPSTAKNRIFSLGWGVLEAMTTPICTSRYHHARLRLEG